MDSTKDDKRNTLQRVILVAGPTASGKTAEAIRLAKLYDGEVISVDSRQVYRELDIGTEKIKQSEMDGVLHHLIDIREPSETYSASDFVSDATALITELHAKGKTPILAGGTHFYFDALLHGLPEVAPNVALREQLETKTTEELLQEVQTKDSARALDIDPHNRRRLIRALEIIEARGHVPARVTSADSTAQLPYAIEWVILDPPAEELKARIDTRLKETLSQGLIEEVARIRALVGDERLNELGLEYRIVGEFLRGERAEASLFPTLSSKLWQLARHQKAWLRKLNGTTVTESLQDKS